MEIWNIIAIGIVAVVVILLLKKSNASLAALVGMAAGALMLVLMLPELINIMQQARQLFLKVEGTDNFSGSVLKITGLAMVGSIAARICADAGESALGEKIIMSVKISMAASALPLINEILVLLEELAQRIVR